LNDLQGAENARVPSLNGACVAENDRDLAANDLLSPAEHIVEL
jgi:hypothetical protein